MIDPDKTKWDHTKEIINTALALGFSPRYAEAESVYWEIDADFGLPTESDVDDFKALLSQLPAATPRTEMAVRICRTALEMYLTA